MTRKRGLRRWLRWATILPAAALILFFALQAFLATPWACRRVAARIEKKVGLETRIRRLSWSPWGGAGIHGLTIAKPEGLDARPLVGITRVRVWPDYGAWLRGRRGLRGIEIVEPRLELDLGLLVSLAPRLLPEAQVPPALAVNEPPPSLPVAPAQLAEPTTPAQPTPSGQPAKPVQPAVPAQSTVPAGPEPPVVGNESEPSIRPQPSAVAESHAEEAPPTVWLTIREATCRVVMPGGDQDLLRLGALDGAFPIVGPGSGRISGEWASDLDEQAGRMLDLTLETSSKGVSVLSLKSTENSSEFSCNVRFARMNGIPFQAIFSVATREAVRWRWGEDWSGSVRPFEGKLEAFGWLLHPNLWTVQGSWRSAGMELAAGGWRMDFDRASTAVLVAGGRVRCPDFRLIGASVSLLGNGWLAGGAGAAVVRITLPPDWAPGVGKQLGGVAWRRLDPADLLYADLTLWLDPDGGWRIELGETGPVREWDEWKACLSGGPAVGR